MSCVDKKDASQKFGSPAVPNFHFLELLCTFFSWKMLCFWVSGRVWIKKMSLFLPVWKAISGLDVKLFSVRPGVATLSLLVVFTLAIPVQLTYSLALQDSEL